MMMSCDGGQVPPASSVEKALIEFDIATLDSLGMSRQKLRRRRAEQIAEEFQLYRSIKEDSMGTLH